MQKSFASLSAFYENRDENGVTNAEKIAKNQKIIRRLDTTDKSKSYEAAEGVKDSDYPSGMVVEDGRLIGFGIHIFNEDVYPLQSFEIYLRGCELCGALDLRGCSDMVFLDIYRNRISEVLTGSLPAMRILGVQDNEIESLDLSEMPSLQGVDAGKNRLKRLDVSKNPELVELYINDNEFSEIDLSQNPKLKYFYCHNNGISRLDLRKNRLLRHIDTRNNPLRSIEIMAPQNEDGEALCLRADEGGFVGLVCKPIYNAQWKETGEWEQGYYAYPEEGFELLGWFDEAGECLGSDEYFPDVYGRGRLLTARFTHKG